MMSTREGIESVQELVLSQESQPVRIDQCVKSQEKPTKIIIVTKFPFFGHTVGNCDFQYKKIDN